MCLSLSSPAEAPGDSMNAPSAPNLLPETLGASRSVLLFHNLDGSSVQSPTRGDSHLPAESKGGIYADMYGEDATREDPDQSSPLRQVNDNSSSLLSPTLVSNSPVSTVVPEAWNASQGNWLLTGNNSALSENEISGYELVPSRMGAGLVNLGNTCFLNAILQCFTHTVPLVQGLRSCTHSIPCSGHMDAFCVICALRTHIESSLAASGQTLSPSKLVDNLDYFSSMFRRYQQEDAHEFMQCVLDKLERCFLDLKKSNINFEDDNLVEKVFGGRLISKLQCCSCGHTSDTYEPLIDLSLEIENVDSLPSALESFTKVENIDAKFRCESCEEEVSMEKQLMLDQTPSIAAFHLKRFKTDGTLVEKIDKHVDFPLELDLQPYTFSDQNNDVPLKYELYAAVVHIGFSSTSGHYFCFVRSAPDTWHKLDDTKVTKVSEDSVLSQEAYILFYARQGTPWFSRTMESQTPCLDPNITSTSPTSVLDVGFSMYKSNPILISNVESAEVGESKEFSELQSDYYCPEGHDFLEINDTSDVTHHCGQFPSGSNQESVDLKGSKGTNSQVLFENNAVLNDSAMYDGDSCIENAVDNNHSCQEVVDFRKNDGFHPLTPPSSPSDVTDVFYISRDHSKMENHGSCKRPSNKLEHSEIKAAVKYVSKMPGSRRDVFLGLVSHQNEVSDKKRKKMDSSQCKKSNTVGVRKKSSQTSVSRPVAAGISR